MNGYRNIIYLFLIFYTLPIEAQSIQPDIRQYSILPGTLDPSLTSPDTSLTHSFWHHPLYELDPFWSDLGNTSTPAYSVRYQGISFRLPSLLTAYVPYIERDDPIVWMELGKPFSIINYISGGKEDKNGQTIKALYSRNMARDHHLTAKIRYYKSDGHYQNQQASATAAALNYVIQKDHYKLYAGFRNHSFNLQENGGIPVALTGAKSKIAITTFHGTQFFDLTQWPGKDKQDTTGIITYKRILPVKLIHTFSWESIYRTYIDNNPTAIFYENVFLDDKQTNDSLRMTSFRNRIVALADSVRIGSFPIRISGGLQPELQRFYRDSTSQTVFRLDLVGSMMFRLAGNIVHLDASFNPIGYYHGDYSVAAKFLHYSNRDSSSLLDLALNFQGKRPDPFLLSFSSNHFRWENDFHRQHQFSMTGQWHWNKIHSVLLGRLYFVSNLVVFDEEAMPIQLTDPVLIFELEIKKEFVAGPFHTDLTLLLQKSNSHQVPLPLLAARGEMFMHHDIHFEKTEGLLELEYGLDVRYWTQFAGYAYMPATGVFYLQNDQLLGNYPILDFFAQVKIKRTRIFVQWNHTLGSFLNETYFPTLHYPYPEPHLKYGIYWHFYD